MIEDPKPPGGRRSRLEDEVLEILYRSDRPPTFSERLRTSHRRASRFLRLRRPGLLGHTIARFDSGLWLIACIVFGIVAFLVRDASPFLARLFAILCMGLILLAIIRSFGRPNRDSVKQWRGRDVDMSPPSRPLWLDRVLRGTRRPPRR